MISKSNRRVHLIYDKTGITGDDDGDSFFLNLKHGTIGSVKMELSSGTVVFVEFQGRLSPDASFVTLRSVSSGIGLFETEQLLPEVRIQIDTGAAAALKAWVME